MPDPERLTEQDLMARYEEKKAAAPAEAPVPEREAGHLEPVRLPRICPECGREFWVDARGAAPGPARYQLCTACRPRPANRQGQIEEPTLTRPRRVAGDD
jgi:hypothetical protein